MSKDLNELGAEAWTEPEPVLRRDWSAIADHLRRKPGEWLMVFREGPTSTANAIRQGDVKALLPEDGFQVTTRNNVSKPHRRCSLYLRYVPPGMAEEIERAERAAQLQNGEE